MRASAERSSGEGGKAPDAERGSRRVVADAYSCCFFFFCIVVQVSFEEVWLVNKNIERTRI